MKLHVGMPATARAAQNAPLMLQSATRIVPDADGLCGHTPRISAGVFCDSAAAEHALQAALQDRRLSRVTPQIAKGGIKGAIAYCAQSPTPDLLILETTADGDEILAGLDGLSSVCDPNTKVVVIGRPNDIELYRAIISKGVSDYLVAPVDNLFAIATILRLYTTGTSARLGRVCAFIGAKGGVGASTLAQNVAWRLGQDRKGPVMLADLDLQFGTAALNLNLSPSPGFSEQAMDPDRLDEALLERSLIQKGRYLHVLPASGRMQEVDAPSPAAVEKLLDIARQTFSVVVLDLPHLQSPWMKAVLAEVDDLVIVAGPDLANLRNTKCLLDIFRAGRPNDTAPRIVLNRVGIAKRAGVSVAHFASGLEVEIKSQIAFDPQAFAKAETQGRLIAEMAPKTGAGRAIASLAKDIDARHLQKGGRAGQKGHWLRMPWRAAG